MSPLSLIVFLTSAFVSAIAPSQPRTFAATSVTAENPLNVERRDEVIAVAWRDVTKAVNGVTAGRVRVADATHELPSQVVDNDGDGTPDELIFLADFWP